MIQMLSLYLPNRVFLAMVRGIPLFFFCYSLVSHQLVHAWRVLITLLSFLFLSSVCLFIFISLFLFYFPKGTYFNYSVCYFPKTSEKNRPSCTYKSLSPKHKILTLQCNAMHFFYYKNKKRRGINNNENIINRVRGQDFLELQGQLCSKWLGKEGRALVYPRLSFVIKTI